MQKGAVKLQYVATEEHIADVLTKPLAKVKFEYLRICCKAYSEVPEGYS